MSLCEASAPELEEPPESELEELPSDGRLVLPLAAEEVIADGTGTHIPNPKHFSNLVFLISS